MEVFWAAAPPKTPPQYLMNCAYPELTKVKYLVYIFLCVTMRPRTVLALHNLTLLRLEIFQIGFPEGRFWLVLSKSPGPSANPTSYA